MVRVQRQGGDQARGARELETALQFRTDADSAGVARERVFKPLMGKIGEIGLGHEGRRGAFDTALTAPAQAPGKLLAADGEHATGFQRAGGDKLHAVAAGRDVIGRQNRAFRVPRQVPGRQRGALIIRSRCSNDGDDQIAFITHRDRPDVGNPGEGFGRDGPGGDFSGRQGRGGTRRREQAQYQCAQGLPLHGAAPAPPRRAMPLWLPDRLGKLGRRYRRVHGASLILHRKPGRGLWVEPNEKGAAE